MGLISSAPAVRLREDYLAITLLAFGEILNVIGIGYKPLIGGPPGVSVPDVLGWAGQYRFYAGTFVLLLVAIAIFAYAGYLIRTPLGRTLRAIRDNEVVARSLGKDITRYRTVAILIGSTLCGIAGSLWVMYSGAVTPTYARFDWTFLPWLMILIGGMVSNRGAFVGTFIFVALDKLILYYKYAFAGILPFNIIWLNYLLLGFITILILIYRPEGIVRTWQREPAAVQAKK
jgi:branched-chain amino acid transport system permease protein